MIIVSDISIQSFKKKEEIKDNFFLGINKNKYQQQKHTKEIKSHSNSLFSLNK